jgi:hypothetical protein
MSRSHREIRSPSERHAMGRAGPATLGAGIPVGSAVRSYRPLAGERTKEVRPSSLGPFATGPAPAIPLSCLTPLVQRSTSGDDRCVKRRATRPQRPQGEAVAGESARTASASHPQAPTYPSSPPLPPCPFHALALSPHAPLYRERERVVIDYRAKARALGIMRREREATVEEQETEREEGGRAELGLSSKEGQSGKGSGRTPTSPCRGAAPS